MATSKGRKAANEPMSLPTSIRQGAVLGGRWRLGKLLGKGACASVFEGAQCKCLEAMHRRGFNGEIGVQLSQ